MHWQRNLFYWGEYNGYERPSDDWQVGDESMAAIFSEARRKRRTAGRFSPALFGGLLGGLLAFMTMAALFFRPGYNLAAVTFLMVVFFGLLGVQQSNRWLGILINERKVMSLSRFQSIVWTVVVLSAYFTITLARVRAGVSDPLAVEMDWTLWALMGMSVTSLVGTPLLLSNKRAKTPDPAFLEGLGNERDCQQAEGLLYVNASPEEAAFTDMFEGDELRDTHFIDIAKVQMFFFTIIAAVSYEAALLYTVQAVSPALVVSLPQLSEGFLALLGISHASYLTSKSICSTPAAK